MSFPFSLYGPLGGAGSPATLESVVVAFGDLPTAVISADPAFGVIGSVVKLDGRVSSDPNQKVLAYTWSFQSVPIGSKVTLEGFKTVDTETDPAAPVIGSPSVVSFSPDVVGEYVIGLSVDNGVQSSLVVTQVISIRAIMIPHGRGLVPDGKFIWSYIRDVWTQVENKEWFETLWSALLQIAGTDLLNLYQTDYDKSIRDIQDLTQRRWLAYEPKLVLDKEDVSFFLDYQQAGNNGSTSNTWLRLATTATAGSSFAVPGTLNPIAAGRVVTLGGRALKLSRQFSYTQLGVTYTLLTSDVKDIPTGLTALNWRAPHTLILKDNNFDDLGVAPGDLLVLELSIVGSQLSVDIPAQVVGVIGDRLAFVLTDQPVKSGIVAGIPNSTYLDISEAFGINTVNQNPDGTLSFAGLANLLNGDMKNGAFKTSYFNTELTPDTIISSAGLNFSIRPKHIIRNRFVPVDVTLLSIPLLQEYIKQPELQARDDGTYAIVRGEQEFIVSQPQWLSENVDFIVGDELAADESLTFKTGTSVIEADTADFVDRNILAGDTFTIITPTVLAGDYPIKSVLTPDKLQLSKPVPSYSLGSYVTARVKLKRRKTGNFIRFVPGRFSASSPAPARLWAEVSFFDNNQTIEDNFGILVGLKKKDLDDITTNVSYRQAVTGLMYALTRGSAVSKIELGVKILLGLPFSEHRGIIRSIENNYRLAGSGASILGRLLIEDVDENGNSLGTMRVYTYPIDDANTDLSGIDTNPTTDLPYAVGDTVERLVSLSKGVQVTDYHIDPIAAGSLQQLLQQFHTFKVKINANVFTTDEFILVSDFLQKITPSYVSHVLPVVKAVNDAPAVTDAVTKKLSLLAGDNASLGLPFVPALDQHTKEGVLTARIGGHFYILRCWGKDLSTVAGYAGTTITTGLLAPISTGPRCKPGDRLIIFDGDNRDVYQISSLANHSLTTYTTGDFRNLLYLWHCDEGTAASNLVDAQGRLNLTPTNSPPVVSGIFNGGRAIPAGGGFSATVANTTLLDAVLKNAAWTVKFAFWIDPSITGSVFPGLNGNGNILSFGVERLIIGLSSTGKLRYFNSASGEVQTGNWSALARSTWHRMAIRCTPTSSTLCTIDFFLNGVQVDSILNTPIPTSFPANPVAVVGGGTVDGFRGQVDEIEMWMYSQTDEEIRMGGKPFTTASGQSFAVMRPVTGVLRDGRVAAGTGAIFTNGNPQVDIGGDGKTDGIQPGDWLLDPTSTRGRFQIISVDQFGGGGAYHLVTVTPTPNFSGTLDYRVVRKTILDTDELFLVSSAGGAIFDPSFQISGSFMKGLLDPLDELQIQQADLRRMFVIDPVTKTCSSSLAAGSYLMKVIKQRRQNSSIGFDAIPNSDPDDSLQITSYYTASPNASCINGNRHVTIPGTGPFELGAKPGDFLVLVAGTNGGVDVGYGAGVYPILALQAGALDLVVNLTATESLKWKVMRNR